MRVDKQSLKIVGVQSEDQIAEVARLADITWRDHYIPIVGQAQVEYMLEKFQSEKAIADQIADGYEYYLLTEEGEGRGYLAVVKDENDRSLFLSKIYVLKSARGCGYGRKLLAYAENLCREQGLKTIWLTVNKNNTASIAWYLEMGFKKTGPIVQNIGNGFVMDDYRMEKCIG